MSFTKKPATRGRVIGAYGFGIFIWLMGVYLTVDILTNYDHSWQYPLANGEVAFYSFFLALFLIMGAYIIFDTAAGWLSDWRILQPIKVVPIQGGEMEED